MGRVNPLQKIKIQKYLWSWTRNDIFDSSVGENVISSSVFYIRNFESMGLKFHPQSLCISGFVTSELKPLPSPPSF